MYKSVNKAININLNVGNHIGRKWFIHVPERHKDNQLQRLEHPCW